MFSFQGSCLTILAFVLLPYRDDLYIIPRPVHPVNTFFASFFVFLRDTLGAVEKESILYTRFQTLKISQKIFKKSCVKGGFSCFSSKNLAIMDSKS